MSFLMFGESGLSGKGFSAYAAPMRLLSRVNSLMIHEPRSLEEAFSTFTAYMGFLYLVSSLMLDELGIFIHRIPTFRKFNFSTILVMLCMGEGFCISTNLNEILYFIDSVLVD